MADLAESLDLLAEYHALASWLEPYHAQDPRYEDIWHDYTTEGQRASTVEHLTLSPKSAREQVYAMFPDLEP